MFVSKAAVLGGGTMGGEIAQVIAAADIPVVVKDIKQEFVDAALEKSREVTKSQLDKLVSKEKLTQEARRRPPRRGDGPDHRRHRLRGLRRRRHRDRGRPREDGDQEGRLRRARRGHPRPRDPRLQHLVALDHRDGARDAAARQGRRLPLLLPGLGDAAGRDHQRRGHLARDASRPPSTSPRRSEAGDHLQGGPGLRRQPDPQLGRRRGLAPAGGEEPLASRRSTRASRRRTSRRWGRSS